MIRPLLPLLLLLVLSPLSRGQESSVPAGEGAVVTSGALPVSEVPVLPSETTRPPTTPSSPAGAPPLVPPAAAPVARAAAPPSSAAPPAPAGPSVPPATPAGSPPANPSSFLQRSNLILAKLLENNRAVDPFGMPMDPANVQVAPVVAEEPEEDPAVNTSALRDALLGLPITGVYPQKGILVLGARTFPIGSQFGIKLQDLTIRLRFEGIRSGELFFRDVETEEVTSIPFNPRPAEFRPLGQGPEPGKGIVPMEELFIAN